MGEDSIEVCYYKPIVEFSVHQDCKMSYNRMSQLKTDSIIYIEREEFQNIIENVLHTNGNRRKTYGDVICIVKYKEKIIGITSLYEICDIHENQLNINLVTIYKLFVSSGYYNYMMPEYLSEDYMIKRYGIPKDYEEILEEVPDFIGIRKIEIKEKRGRLYNIFASLKAHMYD